MQRKTLVWVYLLFLSLTTILSLYIPKNEAVAKDSVVIPGDAIRLRILANSDTDADQALKRDVRDAVNAHITLWVQDLTSLDKAKTVIRGHLPEIQKIAEKVVKDHGSNQSVQVKFGKVQFPTKLYGNFLYPAGEYQAVLITLGEGKGANWWCVLYPPLCFLDFSNGVAVSNGFDEKTAKAETKPAVDNTATKSGDADQAVTGRELAAETDAVPKESQAEPTQVKKPATPAETPSKKVSKPETKKPAADAEKQSTAPVYTAQDEQPVEVKFFIVELWKKLFY